MDGVFTRARGAALFVLFVFACAACARRGPEADAARFLRVGVDPRDEAAELELQFRHAGFTRTARVDGRTFSAVAFRAEETGATAVRIVTSRGIALALDAPYEAEMPVSALSLRAPPGGHHDLDGDGHEEVLVEVVDADRARTCVALVRVGEGGRVREVALDVAASPDVACIESLSARDGRATALLLVRYPHLALRDGEVPEVRIPLAGTHGHWAPASRASPTWSRLREVTRVALTRARAARDVLGAFARAVELAALARFEGRRPNEQVGIFDRSLLGLVLSPDQAAAITETRAHIVAGWVPPDSAEVDR